MKEELLLESQRTYEEGDYVLLIVLKMLQEVCYIIHTRLTLEATSK